MNITEFTPKIVTVLKEGYGFKDFKIDLLAGLTVAIVALPLSMAFAIASGVSPEKGLVTAVIAGFIISLLGGSRVQIGGPTGAFVVVILGVLHNHGFDGLLLASFMAGIILIISGYARLGQIIKYIPHPVITGFTSGIAVLIASSQVKDFFGLKIDNLPGEFIAKWEAIVLHFNSMDFATLALGASSLALIVACRKYAPKLPGYLIAVVLSALAAYLLNLHVATIGEKFPNIAAGLPVPELPKFSLAMVREVMPSAFVIAFLAGIESLLSAVVADGMIGTKHRANQELVAQGFANIASAAFMGIPATGAIARTATNIKAGGRTPIAGIMHAVFILLFMLFAMDIVAFVPLAALAAIMFVVAWGMSEAHTFVHIFRMSKTDRTVMVLTFLLTVMVDLTVAIGIGVTLACMLFMKEMSKAIEISSRDIDLVKALGDNDDERQRAMLPDNVDVFRIMGPVFFGVSNELVDTLKNIGSMPKVLILRMRMVPYLDATGVSALSSIVERCRKSGTIVIFSGVCRQPRRILVRGGLKPDKKSIFYAPNYNASVELSRKLLSGGDRQLHFELG